MDMISFVADFVKDAVVDWATEHPLEIIVIGSVFIAGYYMGRYEELKSNNDRIINLENGRRCFVKKDGEVYLLAD